MSIWARGTSVGLVFPAGEVDRVYAIDLVIDHVKLNFCYLRWMHAWTATIWLIAIVGIIYHFIECYAYRQDTFIGFDKAETPIFTQGVLVDSLSAKTLN